MTRVVLTKNQAEAIAAAVDPVDLVDSSGRTVGRVDPPDAGNTQTLQMSTKELAKFKQQMEEQHSGGTSFTVEEV